MTRLSALPVAHFKTSHFLLTVTSKILALVKLFMDFFVFEGCLYGERKCFPRRSHGSGIWESKKLEAFATRSYTTIVNPTKPTFCSCTGSAHCNVMVIVKNQYDHHNSSRNKVHIGYPLNPENNNAHLSRKRWNYPKYSLMLQISRILHFLFI